MQECVLSIVGMILRTVNCNTRTKHCFGDTVCPRILTLLPTWTDLNSRAERPKT